MKICIIVGTRPEIIKMSPVIHECIERGLDFFIIHSNQHYSSSMDSIFFEELNLPQPKYNLEVGSGKHSNQTGNILIKIEPILEDEMPDFVLVQGDTNTVIAGALAASKLNIKTCHIEAGLRSYDRTMPEETNRIVTDHLSHYQFAVTNVQKEILLKEGSSKEKVFVVGNTITDAVYKNIKIAKEKSNILETNNLKHNNYVLLTAHRSSNVDSKKNFQELINSLEAIKNENIIWPIHPRAKKTLVDFKLQLPKNVRLIEPVGYMDFLQLQSSAKFALTDSGGVQEECCILQTPCITLRENTERPETIEVGANELVGRNYNKLVNAYKRVLSNKASWENPFGNGTSSKQILNTLIYGTNELQSQPVSFDKSICMVGLGYMGLPMACLLANANIDVRGFDINEEKIKMLNSGKSPFEEDGLQDLLNSTLSKKLTLSTNISPSDIYVVSVPTPIKNKKCDLSYVEKAIESIIPHLKNKDLIIIESTIKPGTCKYIFDKYLSKLSFDVLISHCPERAIPGNTLHELVNNDRIVGGFTQEASDLSHTLYSTFVKGNIYKTDSTTAECCKLLENTYRDVNIALANEVDEILSDFGVSSKKAIDLANKHPRVNILSPGPGVGGHCIAIDPWFLIENTEKSKLILTSRNINDQRPYQWIEKIHNKADEIDAKKILFLGAAYKKNVDDTRESPSETIYEHFFNDSKYEVKINDPHVKKWTYELVENHTNAIDWSDMIVILTDHDIFKNYKLENKTVINTYCSI